MAQHQLRPILRLGYSPDPDDAFMWWPLLERDGGSACVDTGRFRFHAVTEDIETLNRRSQSADPDDLLDITAISCAQYPFVQDRYAITCCGASVGQGYGPRLISRLHGTLDSLRAAQPVIAVPGEHTTAFLVASLAIGPGRFRHRVVPFDQIIPRMILGEFDTGLIIHEAQLTHQQAGLHLVLDLGAWWREQFDLPLPLGLNVIRRDLEHRHGRGSLEEITGILVHSIRYALAHRQQGIDHAMQFARDMQPSQADQFIRMYVNDWTLDLKDQGRAAIQRLLSEAAGAGLSPPVAQLTMVVAAEPARS